MLKSKKAVLSFCSVFLVATLLFGAFMPAFAVGESDYPSIPLDGNAWAWMDTVDRALLKESDMNSYSWFIFIDLINCFPKMLMPDEYGNVNEVVLYPNEYAGAFIDENNRLHVVLTKPVDAETEYDYRAITGYDEMVIFDVAKYPLSFLYEVQRTLNGVMTDFDICATGLNEYINRIEINLRDSTRARDIVAFINAKFDNFDEKCLIFKETINIETTAANTNGNALGGSLTSYSGSVPAGTIGFNAYRAADGKYGMVTASHVAPSGTTMYNANGKEIGTPTISTYGGNIDAAFVPLNAGFLGIGKITESYNFYGSYPANDDCFTGYLLNGAYLATGLSTAKIGNVSGRNTGCVTVPNSGTFNVDNTPFTDLVITSNENRAGDSGGPIFHAINLPAGKMNINVLIAITNFGIIVNGVSQCTYGSKVWNIMSGLGVTPYVAPLQYSYVSSTVGSPTIYSPGTVTNAGNVAGQFPDGAFARIYGGVANAGGHILCQLNQVSKGEVFILARSASTNTQIHVYVSTSSNGPWTEITSNKLVPYSTDPDCISCGSYNTNFQYIGIAAIHENGRVADIYIDSIIVT